MILKVADSFINVGSVIVDKRFKTFENISETKGDFGYTFSLEDTTETRNILGITGLNSTFAKKIDAQLLGDDGIELYRGFITIDSQPDLTIEVSFFSGNSNWAAILNRSLRNSFAWTDFDKDTTAGNISASWALSSGVVWPLVDRGTLEDRGSAALFEEDFQPFIYVKDVINTILGQSGLKITGDLIKDPIYNSLITSNNGLSGLQQRISDRTVYIGKSAPQTAISTTYTKITFNDTVSPYSNSVLANWDTSTNEYTAGVALRLLKLEFNLLLSENTWVSVSVIQDGTTTIFEKSYGRTTVVTDNCLITTAGSASTFEVHLKTASLFLGTVDVNSGSHIKVTPVKFYNVYADSLLPDKPASEFLNDLFKMFNIIPSYNPYSGTIKTTKFNSVRDKAEIDISQYLHRISEINYREFITDYSQKNVFSYNDQSSDGVDEYNKLNEIPYGGGSIDIDDDSLETSNDLMELDFVAPLQKTIRTFATNLPFLDMCEYEENDETVDFTSVSDNGADDYARFNVPSTPFTAATQMLRLSNSSIERYNGVYRILQDSGTSLLLNDILFLGTATGTLTGLSVVDKVNEDQIVLINTVNKPIEDVAGLEDFIFEGNTYSDISFAYFYLPQMGLTINNETPHALYFDPVSGPDIYQTGLIDNYYSQVESCLNDFAFVRAEFLLPRSVFEEIDDIHPLRLKTERFNCLFYPNLQRGYEGSHIPVEFELIKI